MLSNRLWRQQRHGAGALMAALGLLAGVMLANLSDDGRTITAGPAAGGATAGALGAASSPGDVPTGDGSNLSAGAPAADGSTTGATGATGAGGPATATASASGTAAAGSSSCSPSGTARGVTNTSVKIGIAYLDLSALAQFPQFKIVDGNKASAAIYAGWKKRGEIPVCGRDVQLKVVPYNVLNAEDQRAACQRLVQDEKVFAVVAHSVFEAGSLCVAKDQKTPVIMPDPEPAATIQAGAPNYFSLSMSMDTMARNTVQYSKSKGLLNGKKVGIYFADDNGPTAVLARETKAALQRAGVDIAAEASTAQVSQAQGANPQPQPDDRLAVQRFQQNGVQVAYVFGVLGRFTQAAAQQNYKPQYVGNDHLVGASDTTASAYEPNNFDGAFTITGTRREEAKLGKLSPRAQQCLDDYVAGTGDHLDPIKRESEWGSLTILCDVLYTALEGLKQTGGNLTQATFVTGLEKIRGLQLTMQGVTTFGPGRHAGGDGYRSLVWRKGTGYTIEPPTEFRPLFVP
jgi:hypothetical protein